MTPPDAEVVVVGAGPYGLSIGAHLAAAGVDFRLFGRPMDAWRQMPVGMLLKSEGFASSLYDPAGAFPLRRFCQDHRIAYADVGTPVSLDTFVAYGVAFGERFLPDIDERHARSIRRSDGGFAVELEDGEVVTARRVVIASGVRDYAYVPPVFRMLPSGVLSHSSEHSEVGRLSRDRVVIVGSGASALDLAALAHHAGADVTLISRSETINFQTRSTPTRPLSDRMRAPLSCIGPGWAHRFFTDAPLGFRALPSALRARLMRTTLGPSGGWFVKNDIASVDARVATSVLGATTVGAGAVRLQLVMADGSSAELEVDKVIAATGYRVDLTRVSMLGGGLRDSIATSDSAPRLSRNFESSVPGLYFVGLASAHCFGPMMRFACGARYTAVRLSRHLARVSARRRAPSAV